MRPCHLGVALLGLLGTGPIAWSFELSIAVQGSDAVLQWPSAPGERFQLEHRAGLLPATPWQPFASNLLAGTNAFTFVHSNALSSNSGFYRVRLTGSFAFNWSGTNFVYSDADRAFTGVLLKPEGSGPFPAVIINHGAGGSVTNYSLSKAREMRSWGLVCIAPNLTHVTGGETNSVNMGFCPENLARITACLDVLATLAYVDTNRIAIFGHSMGAFATIGSSAVLSGRLLAGAITSGGVIPNGGGSSNAAPMVAEAEPVAIPFIMFHCDADPVVPPMRSLLFQQVLNSNSIPNQRLVISSNSIPNPTNWHNIHNDTNVNALVLTNTRAWFQSWGVLP